MINLIRRFKPQPKSGDWEDYFHGRETLIWEGHPARGLHGRVGLIAMSLFGIPFFIAGIKVFIIGISFIDTRGSWGGVVEGLFTIVLSLPFLLAGFIAVFGTWIGAFYASEFVRYGLSNKRAYIAKSWWNHSIESYPIKAENMIEIKQGRLDTVYFFTERTVGSDGNVHSKRIGFEGVENGMEVYQLLRDVQAHAIEREQERPKS